MDSILGNTKQEIQSSREMLEIHLPKKGKADGIGRRLLNVEFMLLSSYMNQG